jgi:hypothetical protein
MRLIAHQKTLFLRDIVLCGCNPYIIIVVDNKEALRQILREKTL